MYFFISYGLRGCLKWLFGFVQENAKPRTSPFKKKTKLPFCNEERASTFTNFQNRKTHVSHYGNQFLLNLVVLRRAAQNIEHSAFQKPKTEGQLVVNHPIDIRDNLFASDYRLN